MFWKGNTPSRMIGESSIRTRTKATGDITSRGRKTRGEAVSLDFMPAAWVPHLEDGSWVPLPKPGAVCCHADLACVYLGLAARLSADKHPSVKHSVGWHWLVLNFLYVYESGARES